MEDFVLSPVGGRTVMINSRYTRLYNNPHFDYLSEMLPKNIKDLFKWCELVFNSMPAVANAIKKLVNYPVTAFSFENIPNDIRAKTKELIDTIHLKSILLDFNTDYYVYGNVFRTVYMPFKRFLVCKNCHTKTAIENCKFQVRRNKIELSCSCGKKSEAEIEDVDTFDIEKIRIVRWDPKNIDLVQNPITGNTRYFYKMPAEFVKKVHKGDPSVFYDSPKVYLEAALKNRNVEFGTNFFHAKTPSLSGYQSGWGISPLMSTLRIYMYIAVLRRAQEAIGMEHITPQRILFPQSAGTSDPAVLSSMPRWRTEITNSLQRWRMDPNYIMLAPYPTGVVNIGSQGRGLAPIEEIKDARNEMAMALDIPVNLLAGDTNIQNSAVSLRILENQLTPQVEMLEKFIAWVIDKINIYMDKEYATPKLVPFRLADDMMNKQILMQMSQSGAVSRTTLQESMDIDADKERSLIKKDQIDDQVLQKEIQDEVKKKLDSITEQVKQQAEEQATGMPAQYNQQKMIAQAQQIAMQLLGIPYEQRKSQLAQLQNEDYVMWAIVSKQLESMRQQQGPQQQPPM